MEDMHLFLKNSKLENVMLRSYLSGIPGFTWCPNVGCDNGALLDADCETFDCENCQEICGYCRGAAHPDGVMCKVQQKQARDDLKNRISIALNPFIKRCPSCDSPISKNGGCRHMKCACGYQFCWLCRRPWAGHSCPYDKLAQATIVPLLVVGASIGSVLLAVPLSFAGGVTGTAVTGGRPIIAFWFTKLTKFIRQF
jgi:hypothetical protein